MTWWQDLLIWGKQVLLAVAAFIAGQQEAKRTRELEDVKADLEAMERLANAPRGSGMRLEDLHEYYRKQGRLRE